jgi:hypothetical protein
MLVKDLNNYVKFVFNIEGKEEGFVTSDIVALKDFTESSTFNIGDIIETGGVQVKITNIQLKQVDKNIRSNKYGFNSEESSMQGELKDSLVTAIITVSEQLS